MLDTSRLMLPRRPTSSPTDTQAAQPQLWADFKASPSVDVHSLCLSPAVCHQRRGYNTTYPRNLTVAMKEVTVDTSSVWNMFRPHYSCHTQPFVELQMRLFFKRQFKRVLLGVVIDSPIRYVRNRLCTCCPIQATTSRLLITEAKYCGEQVRRQSAQASSAQSAMHRPPQRAWRRPSACMTQPDVHRRYVAYLLCSALLQEAVTISGAVKLQQHRIFLSGA